VKRKSSQILTVKKRKKLRVMARERRKALIRSSNRWCLMRVATSNRQIQRWMKVTQHRIKGSQDLKY